MFKLLNFSIKKNIRSVTFLWFLVFSVLSSCSTDDGGNAVVEPDVPTAPPSVSLAEAVFYNIDLNDRSGDSFKVRAFVEGLTEANAVFQFPATAPGTYDEMNFGNYVNELKAYDEAYEPLGVTKISKRYHQTFRVTNLIVLKMFWLLLKVPKTQMKSLSFRHI